MNINVIVNILSGIFFLSELILLIVKRAKKGEDSVKEDKKSLWILWGTILASIFAANFAARVLPPMELRGTKQSPLVMENESSPDSYRD